MNVARLIVREILHRKVNFALGTAAVVIAVGCLAAELAVLRAHDLRTEEIVAAKQAETEQKMKGLEDGIRKTTVDMGFNLLILPAKQNLADLYLADHPTEFMPEEYAHRLAKAKVATINHLLPSLQERVDWKERNRTILLMGVRGEVLIHGAKQKPILEAVPKGTIVLGHELHRGTDLKVGGEVTLMGRKFKVHQLQPARGGKDDITAWINLAEAQAMLGREGKINGMLALECNCEMDRLDKIKAEIGALLPDTQVVEFESKAIARAEARNKTAAAAAEALKREKDGRAALRAEREGTAAVLVPTVMVVGAAWIALLLLYNVRERTGEIGILRAIGLRSRQVLVLFLGKAVLMGLAGAAVGLAAGGLIGAAVSERPEAAGDATGLMDWRLWAAAVPGAALVAVIAAWVPAVLAARRDPAEILRGE